MKLNLLSEYDFPKHGMPNNPDKPFERQTISPKKVKSVNYATTDRLLAAKMGFTLFHGDSSSGLVTVQSDNTGTFYKLKWDNVGSVWEVIRIGTNPNGVATGDQSQPMIVGKAKEWAEALQLAAQNDKSQGDPETA